MAVSPNRSMSNALAISGIAILVGTQLSWATLTSGSQLGSENAHESIYNGLPITVLGILILILGFSLASGKIHAGMSLLGLPLVAGVLFYITLDLRQIHDINELISSPHLSLTPGFGLIISLVGAVAGTIFSILAYTARTNRPSKGPGPGVSSSDSGATVAPSLY